jgi:hypothetical protein
MVVLSRAAAALAFAVAAGGCFDPIYPENIPCSDGGTCPPTELCDVDRICRRHALPRDAGASLDAPDLATSDLLSDLAPPDLAPPPDLALCGSRCPPSECMIDRCVTPLASTPSPSTLSVDADGIYWISVAGAGNNMTSVLAANLDGSNQRPLVTGITFMSGLAVTSTLAYWIDEGHCTQALDGVIYSVPKTGGGAASSMVLGSLDCPVTLSTNGSALFWTKGGPQDGIVRMLPIGGGGLQTFSTGLTILGDARADGQALYYRGSGSCVGTGEVVRHPFSGATELRETMLNGPTCYAFDANNLYWGENGQHPRVMQVALSGGTPVPVATDEPVPASVVSDGARVFWTTYDGRVRAAPVGGAAAAITIYTYPQQGTYTGLAVDANYVYWTFVIGSNIGDMGEVKRAEKLP